MKTVLLAGACAAATLLAGASANAAVVFNFTPAPAHSATAGFTVVDDFSTTAGLTGVNFQIKTPPSDANGAPPANSVPSGTPYLSVLAGGSATYTFDSSVTGFEFDWGSIDKYNTVAIGWDGGGMIVIPGTNFTNPSDGNQTAPGTNGLFSVVGNAGERFNSVTFSSTSNSFEVDNLAVRDAGGVPEPAIWSMMIIGFGGVGGLLRRRGARPVAA